MQTRDKGPGTAAHLRKKQGSKVQRQEHPQASVAAEQDGQGDGSLECWRVPEVSTVIPETVQPEVGEGAQKERGGGMNTH